MNKKVKIIKYNIQLKILYFIQWLLYRKSIIKILNFITSKTPIVCKIMNKIKLSRFVKV